MKSVLIVSDFFIGGGLETRILEQVKSYRGHGVKCYLATDEYNTELAKEFNEVLRLPLRAHERQTIVENVDALVRFCREKEVEMIDVQPLYGVVAASFASALLHVPMSYTLHGLYSIPPADDSLLTWFHIALELRRPEMILVAEYLKNSYRELLTDKDVKVVRNGVTLMTGARGGARERKWIFASRLSEEKAKLLLEAVPTLEKAGIERLDVFGAGESERQVQKYIEAFNSDVTKKMKIEFRGWCDSVTDEAWKGAYEGGIGMDRTALEMMATGIPVMILGYGGLTEGVSEKNFDDLMLNNFTSWEKFSEAEILRGFEEMRKNPERFDVREMIRAKLDAKEIWTERLSEIEELKTDLGRDAMLMTIWQDFYENEGKTREIAQLRAQLGKTFKHKISGQIKKVLPRKRD